MPTTDTTSPAEPKRQAGAWLAIALALVLAAWYVHGMLSATSGRLCAPLDDAYIHFQYARQLAAGEFLRFNAGDPPTTGATSLLYVALLAPYFWLPCPAGGVMAYALALGIAGLVASVWLVWSMARADGGPAAGALAGALLASNGHVLWGWLSGMEVALFGTLALWLLWLVQRRGLSMGWAEVVAGSLLALARPEGAILAACMFGLVVVQSAWARRGVGACARAFIPVAVAAGQVGLCWCLTGAFAFSGAVAKGAWFEPGMTAGAFAAHVGGEFAKVLVRDIGWRMLPFGALVLAIIGLLPAAWREVSGRRLGVHALALAWVFVGVGATCTMMGPSLHCNRYQIPLLGVFALYAARGLRLLCAGMRAEQMRSRPARLVFVVASGALVVLSLVSGVTMGLRYRKHCGEIFDEHVRMAEIVKHSLPADALVATHDVGAIGFFGKRRIYDMIGLVTRNDPRTGRRGVGSMFEEMENLPESQRPTHFVVYPDWVPWERLGLLRPMASVRLQHPAIALPELRLYQADWRLARSGDSIHSRALLAELEGWSCVDRLDVGDVASERAHGYRVERVAAGESWSTRLARRDSVVDAGRPIGGGERWAAAVMPRRETRVAMRALCAGEVQLAASLDEQPPAIVVAQCQRGRWLEWVVAAAPASQVLSTRLVVRIAPVGGGRVQSFHYWVYQRR